jgi:hypothetical protein
VFGTTIEREITGLDWGKEVHKRFTVNKEYAMIEDDMSFMEPIFRERKLPFPEYLTHCGYHPMTQEIMVKMYDQANMEKEQDHEGEAKQSALEGMMDKYGKHFSASYRFPCKGGASISVSVISGKMFYSRNDAPYEIMGVALEDGQSGDEPMPYQTDEQLMIYLAKVLAHSQEY